MKLLLLTTSALLSIGLLGGCGKHGGGHGHANEDPAHAANGGGRHHNGGASQVRFDEEHGLELPEEVVKAIGIETRKVERRAFSAKKVLTGQVVSVGPKVLINVSIPFAKAESYGDFSVKNGRLRRIDKLSGEVSGLADLIFEIDSNGNLKLGDFIDLNLESPKKTALLIPESSVLEGIGGNYVYVLKGDAYRRVKIKTDLSSDGLVEVVDGINPGDTVVTTPVVQLWLVELRLTKGGGHSH